MKSVEIHCPACGRETLLQREAVYDGFTRTGEILSCAACGHVFDSEADVPFKQQAKEKPLFTDADRSAKPDLFEENENRRLCRYCANYTVNPFMQWCSVHQKEVQATDTCAQFAAQQENHNPPI